MLSSVIHSTVIADKIFYSEMIRYFYFVTVVLAKVNVCFYDDAVCCFLEKFAQKIKEDRFLPLGADYSNY